MFQFCIMSGHEGRVRSEKKIYVTLMGALELVRPTYARQILTRRRLPKEGKSSSTNNWQFYLTIMGATEIHAPTLAEEFMDLRELLQSGAINPQDIDDALAGIGPPDISVSSFTLMGGFSEAELPSDETEIDSLAVHQHLGNIPSHAGQVLQLGIGQNDGERRATIRRTIHAALESARL